MIRWTQRGAACIFALVMAAVLLCAVVLYDASVIPHGAICLIPQGAAWAIGCALFAAAACAARRNGKESARGRLLSCAVPWLIVFALQARLFYFAYSLPDWDARTIMTAAYQLAGGEGYIDEAYFAMYPNNVLLTAVFALVLKPVIWILGKPGFDRRALVLILLQCAVSCVTGWLMSRMARRMTGSRAASAFAGAVYVLLIGVTPWLGVPYSNVMTTPVPLIVLMLAMDEDRRPALRWLGIGLITAIGYLIKPQSAIMGISVMLLGAARIIGERNYRALAVRIGGGVLAFALIVGPVFGIFAKTMGFGLDEDRRVSVLHYVALGLNRETAGEYSLEDVSASQAIETAEERREFYKEMIAQRLGEMGPIGLAEHIRNKTMINCGDGSFGWSTMDYWPHPIADKDGVISPLLKDMFEQDGGVRYPYLATVWQCLWLGLLTAAAASVLRLRGMAREARWPMLYMMLAVVGLTLFGWLFETGAQTQMVYVPVYLLLAAIAMKGKKEACA